MFEKATRMKLRFNMNGQISVEDLWDLSVQKLDKLYSSLRARQKESNEDSLLKTATQEDQVLALQVGIVEHVVKTKLEEEEIRRNRAATKMQKDKIAAIIAKKQDESLENMSMEDLNKMMEELS